MPQEYTPSGSAIAYTVPAYADVVDGPTAFKSFADDVYTGLAARMASTLTVNAQTGTTYTLVAADAVSKLVTLNNASAVTVTVPSATFAQGQRVPLVNKGAGMVTFVGSGVTLNGASLKLAQYESATIVFDSATVAYVVKDGGGGLNLITTQAFTTVASVSVNNCFSAAYANYLVRITLTAVSGTDQALTARLRASGTDNSTASSYLYNSNGATSNVSPAGVFMNTGASWPIGIPTNGQEAYYWSELDIRDPFAAAVTAGWIEDAFKTSAAIYKSEYGNLYHTVASSFDGFSLLIATGTMSGTVRVYGWQN